MVHEETGATTVALSPEVQSGNWIALAGGGRFEIYLRLYETQVAASTYALDTNVVPTIARERCR